MKYWTDSRWQLQASPLLDCAVKHFDLPFALIGPSSLCHVRVPARQVAPVAYLLCCFDNRVEIWPLCPMAFARWGTINSETIVLLGRHRLQFQCTRRAEPSVIEVLSGAMSTERAVSEQALDEADDDSVEVKITLAWEGKSVSKAFAQPVTIIGDGHPSTLRAHGRGLRMCDHAIVVRGQRVWMIDLEPQAIDEPSEYVTEIFANGKYYLIGDLQVSLGEASEECEASIQRRNRRRSVNKAGNGTAASLTNGSAVSSLGFQSDQNATAGISSESGVRRREKPSEQEPDNGSVIEGFDCPEQMTSQLTGRLMTIGKGRVFRRRLARYAVYLLFYATAIMLLAFLVRFAHFPQPT